MRDVQPETSRATPGCALALFVVYRQPIAHTHDVVSSALQASPLDQPPRRVAIRKIKHLNMFFFN